MLVSLYSFMSIVFQIFGDLYQKLSDIQEALSMKWYMFISYDTIKAIICRNRIQMQKIAESCQLKMLSSEDSTNAVYRR